MTIHQSGRILRTAVRNPVFNEKSPRHQRELATGFPDTIDPEGRYLGGASRENGPSPKKKRTECESGLRKSPVTSIGVTDYLSGLAGPCSLPLLLLEFG